MFYSDRFASTRPDAARKFMKAYLRGIRVYNDALTDGRLIGTKAQKVADIITTNFKLNPDLVAQVHSPALDPDGMLRTESIRKDFGFFQSKGWLTGDVRLEQVIDTSFAREAAAELGPYRQAGD